LMAISIWITLLQILYKHAKTVKSIFRKAIPFSVGTNLALINPPVNLKEHPKLEAQSGLYT